ncbi:MAG: carbon-nitrogen family hydrolase [Verrucomicrobiae bacterium]|nr:carbon-nitrogen family hydrolase [Verrucomicrobiae bacterium]
MNTNSLLETNKQSLIVYGFQTDIKWKSADENLKKIEGWLKIIKPEPGAVVVLPEMCVTGFCMEVNDICEQIGGKTEQMFCEIASSMRIFIIAGIALKAENGKGRNCAVGFSPDGRIAFRFSKLHPFSLAGEENYYERGDSVVVAEYAGWKISPFICYDLRFPESFRSAALAGAEVMFVMANWPSKREAHWIPLLQARAIENLAYVVGVNRCGKSPEHEYDGESVIISPWGEIVGNGGKIECVIRAEILKETVISTRSNFPALEDAQLSLSSKIERVSV